MNVGSSLHEKLEKVLVSVGDTLMKRCSTKSGSGFKISPFLHKDFGEFLVTENASPMQGRSFKIPLDVDTCSSFNEIKGDFFLLFSIALMRGVSSSSFFPLMPFPLSRASSTSIGVLASKRETLWSIEV